MRMRMKMKMRIRMRMTIIIKIFFSEKNIKMSYYLFNRQEILEKAKKDIQKKKLLNIIYKIKKSQKKKQGIVIKRRKEQNQRVSKEKISRIDSIQKRSIKK